MVAYLTGLLVVWLLATLCAWQWCRVHALGASARPYAMWAWVLVSILSMAGYACWGAGPALHQSFVLQERARSVQKTWAKDGGASVVAQLEQHVAQHPEADKAWYLLARLQWHRGKAVKASAALDHALRLMPDNAAYLAFKKQLGG
jgi:cytochrome c-type biogenesis protein CcmH/NrfG